MNDTPIVWMNGELMPADEVRISPFDLGLMVGVGLFETLPAYDGKVFALDQHHERMESCITLVASHDTKLFPVEEMRAAMHAVIRANDLSEGFSRVRVSLSGGVNPLIGGEATGDLIITAVRQSEPEPLAILDISGFPCNEFSNLVGVKSASYADHLSSWWVGLSSGADEVIRLNTLGDLCECAMANLFLVRDEVVMTPHLESGCLEGVTRAIVLDLCDGLELDSVACQLDENDLYAADELFITSSIREVQSAEMLGSERDKPMPITQMIRKAYREHIQHTLGI